MCCVIRYIDSTEAVRVITLCFTMSSSHVTGSYKVVKALKYIRRSKTDWETSLQQSFEGEPLNLEDNVEVETHQEANHAKFGTKMIHILNIKNVKTKPFG